MRFYPKNNPRVNEKRTVIKFAWLPVKLNDNTVIWLEKYYAFQIYTKQDWQTYEKQIKL